MGFYEEAEARIHKEMPSVKGQKEGAIKGAVKDALMNFARQEEEFAQAIVQGGSFQGCMAAVCKGISTSISDLEAYRRAAAYYFPGSDVRFEMRIELAGETGEPSQSAAPTAPPEGEPRKPGKGAGLVIDLADFL